MGSVVSRGRGLDADEKEELEHCLESTPLLNSSMMSQNGLNKLVKWARLVSFEPGQVVFRKGQSVNLLYVVRSGFVRVTDQDEASGGVILGHGTMLDAGQIRGAGPETEKRSVYITNAVCCGTEEVQLFAISLDIYFKGINRLQNLMELAEFKALSESVLWHDLHSSDIVRLFSFCELREYVQGTHIIKRGAFQNNRILVIVKGSCEVTDYLDTEEGMKSDEGFVPDVSQKGTATSWDKNPIECMSPTIINEECFTYLSQDQLETVNFHRTSLITPKFRKNLQKKMRPRKYLLTVKAGASGCVLLTIPFHIFYRNCADLSELFILHLFRRLEDIEVASHAALHAERNISSGGGISHDGQKKADGDTENKRDYMNAAWEGFQIKGCHYRNPGEHDHEVFRKSPWVNLRVRKHPLKRSLLDLTVEDLERHFDMVHGDRTAQVRANGDGQSSMNRESEHCYVEIARDHEAMTNDPQFSPSNKIHRIRLNKNADKDHDKIVDRTHGYGAAGGGQGASVTPLTESNLDKLQKDVRYSLQQHGMNTRGDLESNDEGEAEYGNETYTSEANKLEVDKPLVRSSNENSSHELGNLDEENTMAMKAGEPLARSEDENSSLALKHGDTAIEGKSGKTRRDSKEKGTAATGAGTHADARTDGKITNNNEKGSDGGLQQEEEDQSIWGWGGGFFTLPGADTKAETEDSEGDNQKEKAPILPPKLEQSPGSKSNYKGSTKSTYRDRRSAHYSSDSGLDSAEDFTLQKVQMEKNRSPTHQPRKVGRSFKGRDRSSSRLMRLKEGGRRRTSSVEVLGQSEDERAKRHLKKEDTPVKAKIGNNLFFGLFDTILCGAPEIVCGNGSTSSHEVGRTPVA